MIRVIACLFALLGRTGLAQNLANPAALNEQAPATYKVKFDTSKGPFVIEVHRDWAPNGADRFYNLVKNGFFDNARFFRVVTGFMVQFGINGDPKLSSVWREARIKDDPVKQSNGRGYHHLCDGRPEHPHHPGIHQFRRQRSARQSGLCAVRHRSGMTVVDALYADYGEGAPGGQGPEQGRIQREGNAYLTEEFANMDYIKKATIEK